VNGDVDQLLSHSHDYNQDNVIIGVGAISEQRSFVPLIKAFSKLIKKYPELRLRLIGHIYYDEALKLVKSLGLEESVEFMGEIPHEKVIEQVKKAAVFYSSLTAKYVGLGTASIEAMLLAVPTVANTPLDLLGKPSLEDRLHLMKCNSTDPSQISKILEALIIDINLRKRVGKGGRAFVQTHLNWELVGFQMVKEFQSTIDKY